MSAKHCSFALFPMKVNFHCLFHEVNICAQKWDPESNILCAACDGDPTVITGRSRVPAGLHTSSSGFAWPGLFLLRCHFWSILIAFICFVCAVTSITAFILWDLSAAGCGSQELVRQCWLGVQQLVSSQNTQNTNTTESKPHSHIHLCTLNFPVFLPQWHKIQWIMDGYN